jgi:hypothetical protein
MRLLKFPAGPRRRRYALLIGLLTGIGLFLGIVGPFGSYFSGPAWQRIAYWTGLVVVGGALFGSAARSIVKRGLPAGTAAAALVGATLLIAFPFSGLVAFLGFSLWPKLSQVGMLEWYGQVVAVALPLTLALAFGWKALDARRETGKEPPRLTDLALGVPPQSVLCLQMEDHYVRVHTAEGSRLVLATLQQSVSLLGDRKGLQVHRSWWVANAAVTEVLSEGRNVRLRLSNGLIAPVARSSVAAVREAGWL